VARASAAASQVMDTKGPKMVAGDFSPEGRVRQTLKDAHLMLDQARPATLFIGRRRCALALASSWA